MVLSLHRVLKQCPIQGHDDTAHSIAQCLHECEPLEQVEGLRRVLLRVAFLAHVEEDCEQALQFAEESLQEYNDERLRRMIEVLKSK